MKYILSVNEIMKIIADSLNLPKVNCEIYFNWILDDETGFDSCEIEVREKIKE